MKKCHISIMCNERVFLKYKLPFLYNNFEQLIFVDYNITNKCNSNDGSLEYIESFNDPENKITLIKDFNPDLITQYNGVSFLEKQKMFAIASKYINNDIDIIWATDLDEFFNISLINTVNKLYKNDKYLISIDLPHCIFVYNEHNYYDKSDFYIAPRITRHFPGKIYGHCNFGSYGKTIRYTKEFLYHFAFVGYNRCFFKFKLYNNKSFNWKKWLETYYNALTNNDKYISLIHPNPAFKLISKPFENNIPSYLDAKQMCKELNDL